MNKFKILLLSLFLSFSFSTYADDDDENDRQDQAEKHQAKFERIKMRQLEQLSIKMEVFEELQNCIKEATNKQEHKACNKMAKRELKRQHKERKALRKQQREEYRMDRQDRNTEKKDKEDDD